MTNLCDYEELNLRPASFRGVPFFVSSDTTASGRRIISHKYPKRDAPYHEDMGRQFETYKVSGYVYGADGEIAKDAILAACSAPGPALLVLPQSAPVLAVCPSVSASRSLDKLGWFTLEFEFREDSASIGGLIGAVVSPLAIGGAFSALVSILGALFVADHKTSAQTYDVVNDAVIRTQDISAAVIAMLESTPTTDDSFARSCLKGATAILSNAAYYVEPDPFNSAGAPGAIAINSGSSAGLQQRGTGRSDTIPAIAASVSDLSDAISTEDAARVFAELKDFASSTSAATVVYANSDIVNNTNEDRLVGAFRRMCLIKWAEALSAKSYSTRSEAVQARADIAEAFYDAILAADFNGDLVATLTQARDLAVSALSNTLANLAPILTIETTTPMSALYWSYRVQGNLDQAERIADRNSAVDWLNIGGEFTVESRA